MFRVTADSNIYISALHFGGLPDRVLEPGRYGAIQLSISDDIVHEVSRVLRDKFGWSNEAISLAEARVAAFTQKVVPTITIDAIVDDPSDNRILECAFTANSDYIVTGDKHLLRLGALGAIHIVTPAAFFDVYGRPSDSTVR